jgi:hypothetical protein
MDHKNYYDVENKINLIYDYNYNLNSKNCFSFDKIILGKIGLDDIKISLPEPNSNVEYIEFYESNKSDVLNGRFKILNFDEESNTILLKKYSNQFPVDVKISFYTNEKKIESLEDKTNNDSLFSYLVSQLVLSKKSSHLLLPIINIDTKFNEIERFVNNDTSYNKIKQLITNGNILDTCCIQLREHFFKSVTLEHYLKENRCVYKQLLFQVIHTLAVLQNEFNGFRHNNLILKNVFLYLKRDSESFVEYDGFKNDKFYLPNTGFDIKIGNFEHAVIPKFYGMSNYSDPNIKFADQPNQYYDLFTFLNDLLEGNNMMSLFKDGNKCDSNTKKFLDVVFPPHLRGLNNNKMTKNIVIARPVDLLYDKYFEEFRNKPSKNYVQETLNNHQYLTGKVIDTFMDSDNYSILGEQDKIKSSSNIMSNKNIRTIKVEKDKESKINRTFDLTYNGGKHKSKKISDDFDDEELDLEIESHKSFYSRRLLKEDQTESETIKIKRTNIDDINLKGGSDKPEAMPYRGEKNTPFISNDQRDTFKKRAAENPIKEPPVLLEQKLYDTSQKPAPKSQFPPAFIPLYDQEGNIANQILPYTHVRNQPPVQKVYNVNLSGPTANLTSINRIYEDVLPGNPHTFTAISIFERKQLIDFLRNSILDTTDGEEMTITGGKSSLLSYIKLMDINPYSLKKNPYLDLARNFLLYRAAYPVRYDDKTKFIGIGKPSMGINVRMYMMSLGDLRCKTINNHINSDHFDLWREIKYYDWVRDEIINRKVSPNFIAPILYKIDSESKIDWSKLDVLRTKGYTNDTIKELQFNQKLINNKHELDISKGLFQSLIPNQFRTNVTVTATLNSISNKAKTKKQPLKPEEKEDLTINSGKMLLLLTEAPTSNIIQWSSPIYESFGSIKKMMSSGYHSPDVWKSILFQLVYSCAVLEKKGIYMENFNLENNIYIKDIFTDPNAVGSWIYKVDNVDYYVPNFGYILLIDSKYTDINISRDLIKKPKSTHQKYKIYGSIYKENSNFDINDIKNLIRSQFRSIIDPDNFRHNMKVKGGSTPPEETIDLLEKMWDNRSNFNSIKDYIPCYFTEYVHNRVGTLLTISEKNNINMLSKPIFSNGNLMIWLKRYDVYEWVVYLGKLANQSDPNYDIKCRIICNINDKYKEQEVFNNTLYGYPENEKIYPETKKNMKYDETHIYETYNLDSIK